jgi:hypothetical protein
MSRIARVSSGSIRPARLRAMHSFTRCSMLSTAPRRARYFGYRAVTPIHDIDAPRVPSSRWQLTQRSPLPPLRGRLSLKCCSNASPRTASGGGTGDCGARQAPSHVVSAAAASASGARGRRNGTPQDRRAIRVAATGVGQRCQPRGIDALTGAAVVERASANHDRATSTSACVSPCAAGCQCSVTAAPAARSSAASRSA